MNDKATIADIQRKASLSPKKSVLSVAAADAKEFQERNQDAGQAWQDSSDVKQCQKCSSKFSLTNRKHHCRECGQVYCGKCSAYKIVIAGALKRACLACYKKNIDNGSSTAFSFQGNALSDMIEKEKSAEALERARRTMTNDLKATKTTKRESSAAADADGEAALPSWAEAFVFLRKIGVDDSASVEAVFPDDSLNTAMMTDIRNSAVLKPMRGGTKTSESHFLFRIRDKLASSYGGDEMLKGTNDEVIGTAVTKTTVFLNCYVLYRQQLLTVVDSSGKPLKGRKPELMRQAIVLVTKWPFPQLAFRLLSKLEEAFFWQIGRIDMGDGTLLIDDSRDNSKVQSSTEITNESAKNVLMVGFGQTAMWPVAKPGQRLYLHFLGEMLQYNVSSDALSTYGANLSFNSVFTSINLVSLLGPYGLVQHLWILWELIIMGQDIVVFSSSPTQCSEVVLALASLTHPMNNVSDFRPYIYKDDSDIRIIALGALGKKRQYGIDTRGSVSGSKEKDKGGSGSSSAGDCKSVIVGTTEPLVLSRLEAFGAAIFLSPEPYGGPPSDPDAPYKGMRTKNAAYYYFLDGGSTNPQTLKAVNNPSTSNTSNWNMKSFTEYFNEWVERGSTKAALVCRHEPSALVQKKTLEKIKKMSPTDRILLGDKLLRDNLHNLTMTYYKPIIDTGVTAEVVQMREVALERAEINHQRAQQAQQEANLLKESLLQFVTESIGFALKFPEWAPHNVPTLLLYGVYMVVFFAAYLLKVPKVVLVSALFLMELPEKAPREFEALLRNIFPKYFLYPKRYNKDGTRIGGQPSDPQARTESRTVLETGGEQGEEDVEEEVSDEIRRQFNGHYRRSRHENLDALLAFQGRNYVQRKINLSLQPTRTFTLSADNRVVRVHERGGPMNTDETFVIGDPDRELDVMGMQKLLTRYYWEGNTLVGRIAILPAKTMVTTAYFEVITNNGKKEIANRIISCDQSCNPPKSKEGICYLEYVEESPHPLPASLGPLPDSSKSTNATDQSEKAQQTKQSKEKQVKKTDFTGMWERTKIINVEAWLTAQGLNYIQRKVISAYNATQQLVFDKELTVVLIQEYFGPKSFDWQPLVIGADFVRMQIGQGEFDVRAYWCKDGSLEIIKKVTSGAFVQSFKRTMDEDQENQFIVSSSVTNPKTGEVAHMNAWFTRKGKATLTPPATVKDVPLLNDDEDGSDSEGEDDGDIDKDEDDDDVAVDKMRKSVMVAPRNKVCDINPVDTSISFENFNGKWQRHSNMNLDSYQLQNFAATMEVAHSIVFKRAAARVTLHLTESSGSATSILQCDVGGAAVPFEINKRMYRARCLVKNGNSFTVIAQSVDSMEEISTERILEDSDHSDQPVMRVISIHRNLNTDEATESMSMFTKEG